MKVNLIHLAFLLAAAFVITACQKEELSLFAPDDEVGLRVNCDPCEGDLIFGPQTYKRIHGKPVAYHRIFNMGEDADVCLTVANNGVVNASISIDGVEVFSPKDFSKFVTVLQVTTSLYAGEHEVTITMKGKPGGSITLEMRGCIDEPPPPILCSEAAKQACEGKGWTVVGVYASEGTLVCTADGRGPENNCDTCSVYNIYVWKDGARDHFCPEDQFPYSTLAGQLRGGHIPCSCGDSLYLCGNWNMQDCVPDP